MFTKLHAIWRVLCGKATVYKLVVHRIELPAMTPPQDVYLASNTFVGNNPDLFLTKGGRAIDILTGDWLDEREPA